MLEKGWVHLSRVDPDYEKGAWKFVRDISATLRDGIDTIVCPCTDCRNLDRHSANDVVEHLVIRGMDKAYKLRTDWYHHGEVFSEATSKRKATTNPRDDLLSQILGPDNPGWLRAMGRGMNMTKLARFQVKSKRMAEMQQTQFHLNQRVNQLENAIAKLQGQTQVESEVGENSVPRSVNFESQPKCVLVDWCGTDDNVATCRLLSSDPDDFVNNIPLGPHSVKVLVESATKPDAFLWRPAPNMSTVEEAVGETIAWRVNNCVVLDKGLEPQDILLKSPTAYSMNKCKLLDWIKGEEVVGLGRWLSREPKALVNGLPLGPHAVKVCVDEVLAPATFLWRPTAQMTNLEDALNAFVAWPANRVVSVYKPNRDSTAPSSSVEKCPEPTKSYPKNVAGTPQAPRKRYKSLAKSPGC